MYVYVVQNITMVWNSIRNFLLVLFYIVVLPEYSQEGGAMWEERRVEAGGIEMEEGGR